MKIQPVDFNITNDLPRCEPARSVAKSRFKRLFERQFSSILRISAPEKFAGGVEEANCAEDGSEEFEPSSVCLAKMVQNFIEESNDRQMTLRCGRKRCTCSNGNSTDSSEDDSAYFTRRCDSSHSSIDVCEVLKSLVLCASLSERNLLADTAKIVEKKKISKRKDDYSRNVVAGDLLALGYDASICKSRWGKPPLYPAGEYEYIDVIVDGERLIVDIDFRSEFEIARPTKSYKAILRHLPYIFVGKTDRLKRIICVVSEAAKQSLRKKGMPFPPWRKADYVEAKWLSPHTRTNPHPSMTMILSLNSTDNSDLEPGKKKPLARRKSSCGEPELMMIFGKGSFSEEIGVSNQVFNLSGSWLEEEKRFMVRSGKGSDGCSRIDV